MFVLVVFDCEILDCFFWLFDLFDCSGWLFFCWTVVILWERRKIKVWRCIAMLPLLNPMSKLVQPVTGGDLLIWAGIACYENVFVFWTTFCERNKPESYDEPRRILFFIEEESSDLFFVLLRGFRGTNGRCVIAGAQRLLIKIKTNIETRRGKSPTGLNCVVKQKFLIRTCLRASVVVLWCIYS